MTVPLETRNALAAARYPDEWNKWNGVPGRKAGKKRQQLRQMAEHAVELDKLRLAGAECSNCAHFHTRVPANGWRGMEPWCGFFSDFQGYQMARPDSLCLRWKRTGA